MFLLEVITWVSFINEAEIWYESYPDLNLHFPARVTPGSCPWVGLAGMRLQIFGRFQIYYIQNMFCRILVLSESSKNDIFGKGNGGFQIFYLEFRFFHQSSSLMPGLGVQRVVAFVYLGHISSLLLFLYLLTYFSLESPERVIGKQCRPWSECGTWSGSPLLANSSAIFL